MIKFNTVKMTDEKMDLWVNLGVNVLLVGEKGVGKTHRIIDAFNRNKIKFSYFSGATLDPWIHLIGIPKVKQVGDREVMDFILPNNLDDDIEAVYVDEFNRCPKLVKNALLELQQFKTINGRKFPNLKMVWAAINPPKDDTDQNSMEYDVEELDPAQMDRFHVIVELPNKPDYPYFKNKYGDYKAKILVDWWFAQSNESKKILSPRRLDYIGELFEKGIDIFDLLPVSANAGDLIKKLAVDENQIMLNDLLSNPTDTKLKIFLKNKQNWLKYKSDLSTSKFWFALKHLDPEYLSDYIRTNRNFRNFAILEALKGEDIYKRTLKEIEDAHKDDISYKVFKLLESERLDLTKYETFSGSKEQLYNATGIELLEKTNKSSEDLTTFLNSRVKPTYMFSSEYPDSSFGDILINGTNNSTFFFRELINNAEKCWENITSHRLVVIKLLIAAVNSFQSSTIKDQPNLLPLLASMVYEGANWGHFNDKTEQVLIRDIRNLKNNKVGVPFIESLVAMVKGNLSSDSKLNDAFHKKIQKTEETINLIKSQV